MSESIEALTKELSDLNATLAKLEEKIKEKKQLKKKFKDETKLATEEQFKIIFENTELLKEISDNERLWRKSEKILKAKYNDVKEFSNSCVPYEKAQILQERKKLEEFKKRNSLADSDSLVAAPEKEDNFTDKKWIIAEKENLAKQKIKNTIVRRYQDQELQRFLEVKRKQENEQMAALHEKLSIMYKISRLPKNEFRPHSLSVSSRSVQHQTKRRSKIEKDITQLAEKFEKEKQNNPATETQPTTFRARSASIHSPVIDFELESVASTPRSKMSQSMFVVAPLKVVQQQPTEPTKKVPESTKSDSPKSPRSPRSPKERNTTETIEKAEPSPKEISKETKEKEPNNNNLKPGKQLESRNENSAIVSIDKNQKKMENLTAGLQMLKGDLTEGSSASEEIQYDDVFKIKNVDVVNCKLEIINQMFEENQEEDFKQIEIDEDMNIVKSSIRGLLRRIGMFEGDSDFGATILTIYDYLMPSLILLKILIMFYRTTSTPIGIVCGSPSQNPTATYRERIVETIAIWQALRFEILQHDEAWKTLFQSFNTYLAAHDEKQSQYLSSNWEELLEVWKGFNSAKKKLFQPVQGTPTNIDITSVSPFVMAQQMTIREQILFQNIDIDEYYHKRWEENAKRMNEQPNEMIDWVSTRVLEACDSNGDKTPEARGKVIAYFVHVMDELKRLRNFNTLVQIHSGLTRGFITSLKLSWNSIGDDAKVLLDEIDEFLSPNNNYTAYRLALDQIADDPCIPFHNLLLKDLCLVENTPKFYDDGKVNFEIFSLLASVYQRLQDFRGFLYELKKNKNIQLFLQNKVVLSIDDLEKLSTEIENQELKLV